MSKSIELESDCPMNLTINILSGKWKLAILWHLSRGAIRFNELQRVLNNITIIGIKIYIILLIMDIYLELLHQMGRNKMYITSQ